jgi:hypothetical protein
MSGSGWGLAITAEPILGRISREYVVGWGAAGRRLPPTHPPGFPLGTWS